jgi:hypothetical protein
LFKSFQDKTISTESKDHLLQAIDLQRLKGVIYRDMVSNIDYNINYLKIFTLLVGRNQTSSIFGISRCVFSLRSNGFPLS